MHFPGFHAKALEVIFAADFLTNKINLHSTGFILLATQYRSHVNLLLMTEIIFGDCFPRSCRRTSGLHMITLKAATSSSLGDRL